jgi:hypothetical protein
MTIHTNVQPVPSTQDALQLLQAAHRSLRSSLDDCARVAASPAGGGSAADRSGLVARLAATLTAHLQMKRELLYPLLDAVPAARDEALAGQVPMLELVQALSLSDRDEPRFAAQLAALTAALQAHQAHEEQHLWPALPPDTLQELGARLAVRRAELMGDQGVD